MIWFCVIPHFHLCLWIWLLFIYVFFLVWYSVCPFHYVSHFVAICVLQYIWFCTQTVWYVFWNMGKENHKQIVIYGVQYSILLMKMFTTNSFDIPLALVLTCLLDHIWYEYDTIYLWYELWQYSQSKESEKRASCSCIFKLWVNDFL